MKSTPGLSVGIIAACILHATTPPRGWDGRIEIRITPAIREYCHIVRFPQEWAIPRFDKVGQRLFFNYSSDYEFRVEGLLGTQFTVAGVTRVLEHNYYTINRYKVDLSNPKAPLLPASRKAWEPAAVVPLVRKSTFQAIGTVLSEKSAEFHGFQFAKSGDSWAQPGEYATRLSPDQAWLVLQSNNFSREYHPTKVFFDVFNADTGSRIFTIEGTYSSPIWTYHVDGYLGRTAWLTERYFIIPLGERKERCLVCDFGRRSGQGVSK